MSVIQQGTCRHSWAKCFGHCCCTLFWVSGAIVVLIFGGFFAGGVFNNYPYRLLKFDMEDFNANTTRWWGQSINAGRNTVSYFGNSIFTVPTNVSSVDPSSLIYTDTIQGNNPWQGPMLNDPAIIVSFPGSSSNTAGPLSLLNENQTTFYGAPDLNVTYYRINVSYNTGIASSKPKPTVSIPYLISGTYSNNFVYYGVYGSFYNARTNMRHPIFNQPCMNQQDSGRVDPNYQSCPTYIDPQDPSNPYGLNLQLPIPSDIKSSLLPP